MASCSHLGIPLKNKTKPSQGGEPDSLLIPRYQLPASSWREKWKQGTCLEKNYLFSLGQLIWSMWEEPGQDPVARFSLMHELCTLLALSHFQLLMLGSSVLPSLLLSGLGKLRSWKHHLGKQMKVAECFWEQGVLKSP